MAKEKLKFISYAYVIGMLFVVLGHSTPTGSSNMPLVLDDIRTFVYCFHMPLFFLISGMLFKFTTDNRKKNYGSFMKNKSIRFLTPYFVLSAIAFLPKILLSNYVNDKVSFDFYYVFEAVFNPRLNVWGHFWFLPTLLIMFSLSYLLLKATKNKAISVIVLILTVAMALFPIDVNWIAIRDLCLNFIYFYSGILFSSFVIENRKTFFKLPIALITAVIATVMFFAVRNSTLYYNLIIKNAMTVIIAFLMMYSIFSVSVLLENKGCKLFDYLDGKTFSIYILSWPCQAIAEMLINRVFHANWYITMPGMFIAGLLIPTVLLFIYSKFKYKPKFINLVFGVS